MTSAVPLRNQALTRLLLPPLRRACHLPGVESQKVVTAKHPVSIAKQKEVIHEAKLSPKGVIGPKIRDVATSNCKFEKTAKENGQALDQDLPLGTGHQLFPVKSCWQGRKKGRSPCLGEVGLERKMFPSEGTVCAKTWK